MKRYYTHIERINYLLFMLLLVAIPASRQWVTYFIGIWAISAILNFKSISRLKFKDFKIAIILGSILLLNLISLIYTQDRAQGISILTTQLSLLVLPFSMVLSRVEKFPLRSVLTAYFSGSLLVSIFLLGKIFIFNDASDNFSYGFSVGRFLDWFHEVSLEYFHHTYISMHLCFGFAISLFLITRMELSRIGQGFVVVGGIILLFTTILIGARSAYVVIILCLTYFTIVFLRKRKRFWGISLLALVFAFIIFSAMNSRLSRNLSPLAYFFISEPAENNLIYNGDFSRKLKYWEEVSPDIVSHEIIDTDQYNAIRVWSKQGSKFWPLAYNGREIMYHSGATYTFLFKYRVIQGSKLPFRVGWGVKDGEDYPSNLNVKILSEENGWTKAQVQYTFKEDHKNIIGFINSMEANAIVDFTDIKLFVVDPLQRERYFDQLEDVRLGVWRTAIQAWKQKPITGYGIGDVTNTLCLLYKSSGLKEALMHRYNAHNQFLESLLHVGISGAILLMIILVGLMRLKRGLRLDLLIIPFLTIILITFLVESALLRLNGVIFFSFWYGYLWLISHHEQSEG